MCRRHNGGSKGVDSAGGGCQEASEKGSVGAAGAKSWSMKRGQHTQGKECNLGEQRVGGCRGRRMGLEGCEGVTVMGLVCFAEDFNLIWEPLRGGKHESNSIRSF